MVYNFGIYCDVYYSKNSQKVSFFKINFNLIKSMVAFVDHESGLSS